MSSHPEAYLQAARAMTLPQSQCAIVSSRIEDLRVAAAEGMKTVYVRRDTEFETDGREVKSKRDGGEVDLVVDSLAELAVRC